MLALQRGLIGLPRSLPGAAAGRPALVVPPVARWAATVRPRAESGCPRNGANRMRSPSRASTHTGRKRRSCAHGRPPRNPALQVGEHVLELASCLRPTAEPFEIEAVELGCVRAHAARYPSEHAVMKVPYAHSWHLPSGLRAWLGSESSQLLVTSAPHR